MAKTIRLTVAQALVKFLNNQYIEFDGEEQPMFDGIFGIFGHGNVVGLGQALEEDAGHLTVHMGRNEQGMAHAAIGYAKQKRRKQMYACTSSVGPGAANMVTAAATATANCIPVLFLPGDTYADRQPDPVLQQMEQPTSLTVTTNDAFRAVCKYWDRVTRPEILMTACINAMRVLSDPADTGAVCIALPQDVEGEAWDYPEYFFQKRVHHIDRLAPSARAIKEAAALIQRKKKPLMIFGGGVKYSEADETFYSDSASYTIEVTSSSIQTWYKADEMEAGKQYLVVSNGYALQNNNGSVAATAVSVSNETIMLNAPSGILWTADSSNRLTNNNQYLGSSSSSSGGGYPGGGGTSSLSIGSQSSAQAWTYDAESNLLTCSISSQWGGATTYYLYYSTSSNAFSINSSASDTHIAALYSTTKPADKQYLSFANSTVRWTVGDGGDHALNQSYDVQAVSGAATTVTYTSSDTDVATINGTRITLKGIGTTTIIATAKEENGYKSATARYTLRVTTPAPAGFVNLGAFNLESDDVKNYLDAAETSYTDDNYRSANGGAGTSIVSTYTKDARSRRMDLPNPVTIDWGTASSGTTTITIFADQDLTQEVWVQNTTNGKTSAAVYNLIPEKTYYCTVEDNTGYLLKGVFTTEGRRRMMLVSTTQNQNNANNCRDLGGLKTTDGRRIKYGMIYRGTNLDGTKNKSIDNYVAPNDTEQGLLMNFMNVGYDIDLRAGGKSALPETQVQYVYGNMDASLSDVTNVAKSRTVLKGFYDAAAAGKAAYFHCAIGSDRTGFWGLLIEGLLGVSVKDCSIDFELTGFAGGVTSGDRPRNSTGYLFFQGMENSSSSTGFKGLRNYEGNTFQEKCANYVKSLANDQYPFTDEWIETFRNNVLEDI